jgi:protein tyrosine/serine phosphatase
VAEDRFLDWDGCYNLRDFGGIPVSGGGVVRWGAVVRADNPEGLTREGWAALVAHGVRTIVDLRNDDERHGDTYPRPAEVTTVHMPLDDVADTALWTRIRDEELDGSPLYYPLFLARKPERCAAAIAAIAQAVPGGVLFHCGLGRDRTGLVSMLLLALAGVAPADIATDYEQSAGRLEPLLTRLGWGDQLREIEDILARKNTTARAAVLAALDGFDAHEYLRAAGLREEDLEALRRRLLEPAQT